MSAPILSLTKAVVELPEAQRAVLVPLFAWVLIEQAPKTIVVPPALLELIEEFFASLGPDKAQWAGAIDERMRTAGVTAEIFQRLALETGTPTLEPRAMDFGGATGPGFQPRAAPASGQAPGGPGARFALQDLSVPARPGRGS